MNTNTDKMTRGQVDWLIAFGLVAIGAKDEATIQRDTTTVGTELFFGQVTMSRCQRCGREYYTFCINCGYRQGGNIMEEDNYHYVDAVEGLNSMHRSLKKVASQLRSMGCSIYDL